MEVFVQVVDAGGFTRAAEHLQLPKATVSTLVQSLEHALQVKLLHRTTRHVSVTSDGAAYYERCLRILADVREAEDALSRNRASPSGRLRVDVGSTAAHELIIPALPGFFQRYPDIRLELGCGDRPVELVEEGVDCAVRGGALGDSSLIARRIGVVQFVTCATPDYLARRGIPTHPDELKDHACISYFSSKSGRIHEWDFRRGNEEIRITPPSCVAVNDSMAYVRAGLEGLGVLKVSRFAFKKHSEAGRLREVLADWETDPIPVHVVYPQNRHLSAKVRVFVEWVADLFAEQPEFQIAASR